VQGADIGCANHRPGAVANRSFENDIVEIVRARHRVSDTQGDPACERENRSQAKRFDHIGNLRVIFFVGFKKPANVVASPGVAVREKASKEYDA
jgi:hypothetical protein